MRAKHPEMASDQAKMGLKWGVLASESTRIIENEPLRQQRSCARWVFPQPARVAVRKAGKRNTAKHLEGAGAGHGGPTWPPTATRASAA